MALSFALILALFTGCASDGTLSKAAISTGVGASLGLLVGHVTGDDSDSRWLGAGIGAIAGYMFGNELDKQAAEETITQAARDDGYRPVTANLSDGSTIQAQTIAVNAQTNCRKVRTKIWKGGELVGEDVEEVCTGQRNTNEYF